MEKTASTAQFSRPPDDVLRRAFGEPEPQPVYLSARPEISDTASQLTFGEMITLGIACASLVLGIGKVVKQIRRV